MTALLRHYLWHSKWLQWSCAAFLTHDEVIFLQDGLVIDDLVWVVQWSDQRQGGEANAPDAQARDGLQHLHTHGGPL